MIFYLFVNFFVLDRYNSRSRSRSTQRNNENVLPNEGILIRL